MESLQKFFDKENNCIAIVIRKNHSVEQTTFYSEVNFSQQLGIIKYPKNGIIKPHFHNEFERSVFYTQEVLIVRKGVLKVLLFDLSLNYLESLVLDVGDIIFLVSGGHGFEMLEDCELIEIKQGPYNGVENDKTYFNSEVRL